MLVLNVSSSPCACHTCPFEPNAHVSAEPGACEIMLDSVGLHAQLQSIALKALRLVLALSIFCVCNLFTSALHLVGSGLAI